MCPTRNACRWAMLAVPAWQPHSSRGRHCLCWHLGRYLGRHLGRRCLDNLLDRLRWRGRGGKLQERSVGREGPLRQRCQGASGSLRSLSSLLHVGLEILQGLRSGFHRDSRSRMRLLGGIERCLASCLLLASRSQLRGRGHNFLCSCGLCRLAGCQHRVHLGDLLGDLALYRGDDEVVEGAAACGRLFKGRWPSGYKLWVELKALAHLLELLDAGRALLSRLSALLERHEAGGESRLHLRFLGSQRLKIRAAGLLLSLSSGQGRRSCLQLRCSLRKCRLRARFGRRLLLELRLRGLSRGLERGLRAGNLRHLRLRRSDGLLGSCLYGPQHLAHHGDDLLLIGVPLFLVHPEAQCHIVGEHLQHGLRETIGREKCLLHLLALPFYDRRWLLG
mmetsp:Transcript_15503/g.32726  ORF Transcript_15503/g.32726 Transcript_15503/m.32726 type:complete len:391 (+) Transcript_15503:122-1294(+)